MNSVFRIRLRRFAHGLPSLGLIAITACYAAPSARSQPASAPPPERRFPFVMPWDDVKKTAVDVSALNPAPLTDKRRIAIKNGHFYDQTGRRVRFLATNIGGGACFPAKEDGVKIAGRLRKFGFNMVRLHHMDAPWAEPNLFHFSGMSYGKKTNALDARSLDRLDHLVYQFKRHGIYVDMNLHVTRQWGAADGFPDADKINQEGKAVSYFDPRALELQKQYARQLLTHRNPYTGTRYVEEPTVALVELTNEDSLLGSADSIPGLPEHYRGRIARGWNAYLKQKYGSTARLLQAWNTNAKPLGANLIANGRFENGTSGWTQEQQAAARYTMSVEGVAGATNAPEGRALHLSNLQVSGTDWHLQTHYTGLDLKDGETYTVSFAARAGAPRGIGVQARYDRDPWNFVGLDQGVALTTDWKRFTLTFVADKPDPNHSRLSFVIGGSAADVYLANVSIRPGGGGVALGAGQTLEAANLPLPGVTPTAPGRDYVAYLMDVEERYAQGMKNYVQKTLGAKAPVACSQASYGGLGGVYRESKMDWVDMHAYWEHPSFPGRAFDPNDFRIPNTAMVKNDGAGSFEGLAMHRVAGKPFTVSEYDHPAPNEYAAEGVPMILAYAAWQDWDGVFLFAHGGRGDRIESFFDMSGHPGKMAFLPWAAYVFLRGDLNPSPNRMQLQVPTGQVAALKAKGTDYSFWHAATVGKVASRDFLRRQAAVRFVDKAAAVRVSLSPTALLPPPPNHLDWDQAADLFTVDTPTAKAVVGFLGGKQTDLSGLRVAMEPTARNFLSLTLASRDGKPTPRSTSLLLTTVDKAENPGLLWNKERTYAQNAWKSGPVMAEAVPALITLNTTARSVTVYALDATGARNKAVPSRLVGGRLTFRIDPAHRTLWYEISASQTARATARKTAE